MSEETVFEQGEVQNQSDKKNIKKNEKGVSDKKQANPAPEVAQKGKKKRITSARVTTAASLAGLAVRLFTPLNVFPRSSDIENEDPSTDAVDTTDTIEPTDINDTNDSINPEPAPEALEHLEGHDLSVASEVNDSMSFNEAFAAAREEIGRGGVFVWHGHTYGTYYKNEWDAMSQEDKDQYWADVHHTSEQIHYEDQEVESDIVSDVELDEDPELVDEQKQDDEEDVEVDVEDQELLEDEVVEVVGNEEGDSEIVEVELDAETDEIPELIEDVDLFDTEDDSVEEVSFDENEIDEIIKVEDEEPVDVSTDDNDEMEVLVDDIDESDEFELAMETDEGIIDESWLSDTDSQELDDMRLGENEMMETDDEMNVPDDMMDSSDDGYATENADIDVFASTSIDPDIEIENDMDMSDYS